MRASSAANAIVPHDRHLPRHQKVWSSSGASMPCSRTTWSATTIVSPSITFARPLKSVGARWSARIVDQPGRKMSHQTKILNANHSAGTLGGSIGLRLHL